MTEYNASVTSSGSMKSTISSTTIPSEVLDGIQEGKETRYRNSDWDAQVGLYKNIPEYKIAMDVRPIWTVGDEIEAPDPRTKAILDNITGWGKDTFRSILKNMIKVKRLGQDSYAEIIRDPETLEVVNLKILNTGRIEQVYNDKGQIIRYEQLGSGGNKVLNKYKTNEIFHLTQGRLADEIHGVEDSVALKRIIEAANENFEDVKRLMHLYVKPILHFKLKTDDQDEINRFIDKYESANKNTDNIYTPSDLVEFEVISVPPNSTLPPIPWRDHLKDYFFQVCGIPQIIMGSSGEFTESTAKIAYLAFEQSVKDEQADIIEQVFDQLGLRIKLTFPASLKNELLSDENKDGPQTAVQPAEVTAGVGR